MPSTTNDVLPVHPFTGLEALGIVGGRPVWPVMGASDDDAGDGADDATDDGDALGDETPPADSAALTEERTARKTLETVLADLTGKSKGEIRRALKGGSQAALQALRPAPKPEGDEPDADAVRREAERAANDKANARIVRAEIRAQAADLFADPADAHLYVDLSSYDVDDDGEIDGDQIVKDLKQVLTAKPHLAKKGTRVPRPDPSQRQGGGGKPESRPGVDRMRAAYAAPSTP